MGYIDEVRREAERVREEKSRKAAEESRLESIYRDEVRPRMLAIHQFLLSLVGELRDAEFSIVSNFKVPGIGDVELSQADYRLLIDSTTSPREITLSATCRAENTRRYVFDPLREAELRNFLASHRCKGEFMSERSLRGPTLHFCESSLLLTWKLTFRAEVANSSILLEASDFWTQGVDVWLMRPDASEEPLWLDNLAGFILRKSLTPVPISAPRLLSEVERSALKQRLDEVRVRQEATLAEEAQQESTMPDLLGRIRLRVLTGIASLRSFLPHR
jgi:hypothetical protein